MATFSIFSKKIKVMKVICIESTTWAYNKKPELIGKLSTQKGAIYHVTETIEGHELRKDEKFSGAADGTWYDLLELGGWHHSMRFLEIPDDKAVDELNCEYSGLPSVKSYETR